MPTSGDTISMANATHPLVNDLAVTPSIAGIDFVTQYSPSISGNPITMSDGAVINAAPYALAGSNTLSAGLILTGATTVNADYNVVLTFSGTISGQGDLLKCGTGPLELFGNNSYSGPTTITNGTLRLGCGAALSPNSVLTVNGGVVDLNGLNQTVAGLSSGSQSTGSVVNNALGTNATLTIAGDNRADSYYGSLKDSGGVGGTLGIAVTVRTDSPTGQYSLALHNNTNTYSGATSISASGSYSASLVNGTANALSANSLVTVGAMGLLRLENQDARISGLAGNGTVLNSYAGSSIAVLTVNNFSENTFAGSLQDGSATSHLALTKSGPATLTLSGANTHTGATTIASGALRTSVSSALSSATTVVFASSAIGGRALDLAGTTLAVGGLMFNAGATNSSIVGGGTLALPSAGAIIVNESALTDATVSLNLGTNEIWTIAAGKTLAVGGNVTFTGRQLLVQGGGVATFSGAVSGQDFRVSGGSSATFTGSSSLTATFWVIAGSGTPGAINWYSSGYLNPGSRLYVGFHADGSAFNQTAGTVGSTISDLEFTNALDSYNLSGGVLRAASVNSAYSGNVPGTSALNLSGTGIFQATSNLISTNLHVTLNGASSRIDTNTYNAALNGVVSGGGTLAKLGNGALTLAGTNTYTGSTTIFGGTLRTATAGALPSSTTVGLAPSPIASRVLDLAGTTQTVAGLVFYSGATNAAVTGGGTLSLPSAGTTIIANESAGIASNVGIIVAANQTWTVGSGKSLSVAGNVNFTGKQLLIQGLGSASFGGTVSGQDFRVNGNGTATFAGSSNLTAAYWVLAGSGTPGTINWNSTGTLNPGGRLYVGFQTGGSALNQNGGIVGSIASDLDLNGNYTLNGGTLRTASVNSATGGIVPSAIALTLGGSGIFQAASNLISTNLSILLSGTTTRIDTNGYSMALNGRIAGSADAMLTKTGNGTLILTGNGQFGPTTISQGVLQIGTLADGSIVSLEGAIHNNAVLKFASAVDHIFSNNIDGIGSLVVEYAPTKTLRLTGALTYTSGDTVISGTLLKG
jgi:autotransporter-associated beta strand protein